MPRYDYRATDAEGNAHPGREDADDLDALARSLGSKGLRLESAEIVSQSSLEPKPAPLSDADAREAVHEIAAMAEAGLPLGPGLRALGEDLPSGRLSRLLATIADRVDAGASLESALDEVQDRFPPHLRGLLLAGTKSGRTAQVLGDFVGYAQVGANLRRTLWLTLAYPILLVLLFSTLAVFVSMFVVSGFESIFQDFGIGLPVMTRILLGISHAVTDFGPWLLIVPLALIVLGVLVARLFLDAPTRRRLLRAIPLFGPLWRWTSLAEFSHFLGLLVESSVPLQTAVTIAADGAQDAELARAGRFIADRIQQGQSLGEAARESRALPDGFTGVLNWAESHRSLPESLHMAGEIFETQAQSRARFIGSVVMVLTVVTVIWGCGFLVVALFMPLIRLVTILSG